MKEPLVHFVVLGAALFMLYAAVNPGQVAGRTTQIDIGPSELEWISTTWVQQYRRVPTVAELGALVDDYVRDEVLYREALAMGLDRDDIIVKRRMAQKLGFLTEDAAKQREPTRAEIEKFFAANLERYRLPPRLTFTHIYFSTDQRGSTTRAEAARVLATLQRADAPQRAPEMGDRFMLQYDFADRSRDEIATQFGGAFAESLFELSVDPGWQGPLTSGFGIHLVRIIGRTPGRLPALDEVAPLVTRDFEFQRGASANAQRYAVLRDRYTVRVDSAEFRRLSVSGLR